MTKQPKSLLETAIEVNKFRKAREYEWNNFPYDGILGKLPDEWVQPSIIHEFESIRVKLLETNGYSAAQIKQSIESHSKRMNQLTTLKHSLKLLGITPIPKNIRDDIERLFWFKRAINAGYPEGLYMLHDRDIAEKIIRDRKEKENLKLGRQKGAARNKERAVAVQSLAKKINDDLLKNLTSARWNLERRANYIVKTLTNKTIEIDGKPSPAKMVNGKNYSSGTIKGWIIGT